MNTTVTFLADAPKLIEPVSSATQLILAFIVGIGVIVVLITLVTMTLLVWVFGLTA